MVSLRTMDSGQKIELGQGLLHLKEVLLRSMDKNVIEKQRMVRTDVFAFLTAYIHITRS